MSIVTKKGDDGKTSLCGPMRVAKDHIKIEACGVLYELNSFLGMSRSLVSDQKSKKLIEFLQEDLFAIGSEIASEPKFLKKLKRWIGSADVSRIEKIIAETEKRDAFKASSFVLPGKNFVSSILDISRSIARRAERRLVTLTKKGMLKNKDILIYMNRLSDLLYLLARRNENCNIHQRTIVR